MTVATTLIALALTTSPLAEPVTTTGYCWHSPCVNEKHAKGVTKSGTKVQPGVCAADWKVFPKESLWFVPGYGLCRVEDTGRLVKGKHLDLYFDDIRDAINWGRQKQLIRRVMIEEESTGHEDQDTIGTWAIQNFGRPTPLAVLRRSCDELLEAIELCVVPNEATRTMFKAMRLGLAHLDKYELHPSQLHFLIPKVAEELADSAIVNAHAATVMNIDLQSFVNQKMQVNRRRKWRQNADGTGQHIDEALPDEDVVMQEDMSIDMEEETRL